jgi:hypothetical protein
VQSNADHSRSLHHAVLERWFIARVDFDIGSEFVLCGRVFGHRRLRDGHLAMTSAVQQLAEDGSCARTLNTIYWLVDPIDSADIDQFWEHVLPILAPNCARGSGRTPISIEGGVAWPYSRSPVGEIWQSEFHDRPAVLVNWLIVKLTWRPAVSTTTYHLSGIVFGHPRLPDQHQVVTTTIQELAADLSWARTRARLYQLQLPLSSAGIDEPLKSEIREIASGWGLPIENIEYGVPWPGIGAGSMPAQRH